MKSVRMHGIYAIRVGGGAFRALELFYCSKKRYKISFWYTNILLYIGVLVNSFSYLYTQNSFSHAPLGILPSRHEVGLYLRYISKDALDAFMIIDFNSIYVSCIAQTY